MAIKIPRAGYDLPQVIPKEPDYQGLNKSDMAMFMEPSTATRRFGDTLEESGLALKKKQDEQDDAEVQKQLIEFEAERRKALDDAQRTMRADGEGHAESYDASSEAAAKVRFAAFRDKYGDNPKLLQKLDTGLLRVNATHGAQAQAQAGAARQQYQLWQGEGGYYDDDRGDRSLLEKRLRDMTPDAKDPATGKPFSDAFMEEVKQRRAAKLEQLKQNMDPRVFERLSLMYTRSLEDLERAARHGEQLGLDRYAKGTTLERLDSFASDIVRDPSLSEDRFQAGIRQIESSSMTNADKWALEREWRKRHFEITQKTELQQNSGSRDLLEKQALRLTMGTTGIPTTEGKSSKVGSGNLIQTPTYTPPNQSSIPGQDVRQSRPPFDQGLKSGEQAALGVPANLNTPEAAPAGGAGGMVFPVQGYKSIDEVPSDGGAKDSRNWLGPRKGGRHAGLDIPGKEGTPILMPEAGTILKIGEEKDPETGKLTGYGKYMDVATSSGKIIRMGHARAFGKELKEGDQIDAGYQLGEVGHTGNATADFPHLHFEVFPNRDAYEQAKSVGSSRLGAHLREDPRTYLGGAAAPASAAQAGPAQAGIAQEVAKQYPAIAKSGVKIVPSTSDEFSKPGGNMLEYWPPGEPGTNDRPRPGTIPSKVAGVEYGPNATANDIAADVVSHGLARGGDKKATQYYSAFAASLTPKQEDKLQELYQASGDQRDFEQWREQVGIPTLFRGYAFKQWEGKAPADFYTEEQKQNLDEMMSYLRQGGQKGNQSLPPTQQAAAPTAGQWRQPTPEEKIKGNLPFGTLINVSTGAKTNMDELIKVQTAGDPEAAGSGVDPLQRGSTIQRLKAYDDVKREYARGVKELDDKLKDWQKLAEGGLHPTAAEVGVVSEQIEKMGDPYLNQRKAQVLALHAETEENRRLPLAQFKSKIVDYRRQLEAKGGNEWDLVRLKHMETMYEKAHTLAQKDPNAWATEYAGVTFPDLDLTDPKKMQQYSDMSHMAALGAGLKEPIFFSEKQRNDAQAMLKQGGKPAKDLLMGMVKGWGPDDAQIAIKQIAKEDPELLAAGMQYVNEERAAGKGNYGKIADEIVYSVKLKHSENFEKTHGRYKPKEQDRIDAVGPALSTAYMTNPETKAMIENTADLLYMKRAAEQNVTEFKPDMYKQAVLDATGEFKAPDGTKYGGVYNTGMYNRLTGESNHHIDVPSWFAQNGVPKVLNKMKDQDLTMLTWMASQRREAPMGGAVPETPIHGNGKPATMADLRYAQLISTGDGKYQFSMGPEADGLPGKFLKTPSGRNYEMDLYAMRPWLDKNMPELLINAKEPRFTNPGSPPRAYVQQFLTEDKNPNRSKFAREAFRMQWGDDWLKRVLEGYMPTEQEEAQKALGPGPYP